MDIKVLQKDMIAAMKARDKARKESISALIQAVCLLYTSDAADE